MIRRLVVVGDALLDVDAVGTSTRLCPDAPVPVVDDVVEHFRPGGAALAAALAARDGHGVTLVTAWGDDDDGRRLAGLLGDVTVIRLPYDGRTCVKYRVRTGGQSIVRLDHGTAVGRYGDVPGTVGEALADADAVLVSDYGRGVTGLAGVRDALTARPHGTPVVWDPHPRGSEPVLGCTLVTPNAGEAADWAARYGTSAAAGGSTLSTATRHAEELVEAWRATAVAVTLSARGALLSYGSGTPVLAPAPPVDCLDSCGAGDRFAVSAAAALGAGRVTSEAVCDAVEAASTYVASGGPATLRRAPQATVASEQRGLDAVVAAVRAAGGTVVATGGCFDLLHAGHVATLRAARRLGECLVVCLNSDASVRRLKGPGRPLVPASDRAQVLQALECVDAVVVFDEDTPVEALHRLRPDVWVKGGDYAGRDVPEASALASWGGQTVVVPYLEGRSTSRLVATAANRGAQGPLRAMAGSAGYDDERQAT